MRCTSIDVVYHPHLHLHCDDLAGIMAKIRRMGCVNNVTAALDLTQQLVKSVFVADQ
jgi:hypothetical protein